MAVAFISDQELERRALDLIAQYEQQIEPVTEPPIPIDLIIELVLGIDIDWAPIDQVDEHERVLAAIEMTAERRKIVMNEREQRFFDQFFGTEAFSKAHEVGHAELHLPRDPGQQLMLWPNRSIVFCRSDLQERQEIQAERFGAFLLMPEELLRRTIDERFRGRPITSWPQIYELRDTFEVSVTAMCRRLERLNLAYVDAGGRVYASREDATGQRPLE